MNESNKLGLGLFKPMYLEQKQLSFEQICPKWTKAVLDGNLCSELGSSYGCCIVGEANGFSDDYISYDKECKYFADILVNDYGSPAVKLMNGKIKKINYELFEERTRAFVKHWNEHHLRDSNK